LLGKDGYLSWLRLESRKLADVSYPGPGLNAARTSRRSFQRKKSAIILVIEDDKLVPATRSCIVADGETSRMEILDGR